MPPLAAAAAWPLPDLSALTGEPVLLVVAVVVLTIARLVLNRRRANGRGLIAVAGLCVLALALVGLLALRDGRQARAACPPGFWVPTGGEPGGSTVNRE